MHFRLRALTLLPIVAALLLALPADARAQASDYVIGAKDILTVTVWEQPDLTGKFTVEADGSFNFPLVGRVKAGGLTLKALEAEIRKLLIQGEFFRDPQVNVPVAEYVSHRVLVLGEVRQPGPQPLTGDMTLIEALSRAGSTLPTAGREVVITHAPKGQAVAPAALGGDTAAADSVRVDLKDLQEGNAGVRNIVLRDGDTIYVTKAEMIYVSGQVKNPGAYPLQTKDTTVLQALALAGGITDRGAANRVRISRVVNGKKVDVKVKDLTDLVQNGDTIIVPERFF